MYLNPITVDGVTYNFTEESLKELIRSEATTKQQLESTKAETIESYRKIAVLRNRVYDFFTEAFDGSTHDDETTVERDEVNSLLESIGSDSLTVTWSATVEITVTVNGIKATSAEEVEDIINNNIDVSGYDIDINDQDIVVNDISRE